MHCPDCGHLLTPVPLGVNGEANQSYRCYRCGGFWLEGWLANRVSTKTLDKWPQTGIARAWAGNGTDECPTHVGMQLQRFIGESVPADMVVKRCRQCGWFWFPGNTLFSFKPAQEAKTNYYRLWNLPPSTAGLMLPIAALVVLIGGGLVAIKLVRDQQYALINASGVITEFTAVYEGNGQVTLSFKSVLPVKFIDLRKAGDSAWTTIMITPQDQQYQFNLAGLSEGTEYELKIFNKIYRFTTTKP